jgi:anaerobic magnesium-protoporphyrin IX monomethyl ester cyclase
MKTALIYPPFMDPRAPQLALPSLAAFLRANGASVTMRDLAIDGLLFMTEPESLERCRRALVAKADGSEAARSLCRPFDRAIELAPWALSRLRDPEAFFDSRDFSAARDVVGCIVRAQAAAIDERIRCNLHPIVYEVQGFQASRFRDLLAATDDARLDLFGPFYAERIVPELEAEAPDAVGISLTNYQQWLPGLALARLLKKRGFFVVLGGALISKFVNALSQLPDFFRVFADGVIAYEGETALLELLAQLQGKRRFDKVPNLVFFDGRWVRANATRVEDVNALPTPDFDGLPLHRYLAPARVLPILTGKGCYFNRCKFCEIPFINHVSAKPYRIRSAELIVEDVRTLARKHDAKHFVITDEALSPKLLLKLAEGFRPFAAEQWHFTGYARLEEGFSREVFDTISAMGVRKLFFGMESASQTMIDHMDKGTDAASVAKILRDCRDAGIRFHVFSIIGFPEETEAMARETYRFLVDHREILETPGNSFGIRRFHLELRTEYFTEREAFGVRVADGALEPEFLVGLDPDQWENTRGLSAAEVERLLNEEFNPGLVRTFKRIFGGRFQVWPASEEYAVLYCAYYAGKAEIPFRAALPELDDPTRVTLRVNPAVAIRAEGELVSLAVPAGSVVFPRSILDAVIASEPRSTSELLGQLGESESDPGDVVRGLDALIGAGFLQLEAGPARSLAAGAGMHFSNAPALDSEPG